MAGTLFDEVDLDGNGVIDYNEIKQFFGGREASRRGNNRARKAPPTFLEIESMR